jgi:prepilin-type processing-associated H-X9-DG protein/prepilin-type N-terminal cleavage/methylation domain-containing protein
MTMSLPTSRRQASAFTLVELLACIAIIGVLTGISIIAISKTSSAAKGARCMVTMRSWVVAVPLYVSDNKGKLPQSAWDGTQAGEILNTLVPYAGGQSNWTGTQKLRYAIDHQCPVDEWGYGCNSFVSVMAMAAITEPGKIIYMMDTHNNGRWINGSMLVGSSSVHGLQLKYAFPRPHKGKVNVTYLDGHAESRNVSSLTFAMFTKDTSSYVTSHDTRYVITAAEEAAAELAAQ